MPTTHTPQVESLCWSCARAGGGYGCPWIDGRPSGKTPVLGVETIPAQHTEKLRQRYDGLLHKVAACPLFAADGTLPPLEQDMPGIQQHSLTACGCKTSWGAYK